MEQPPSVEALTPTKLSRAVGISVPYASQILKGEGDGARTPSLALAIRIYRATGHKLGPVAGASDAEIDTLERFQGSAA
jgi:transcriptional regulator with XRE-family HTH domain